jgi:polysaccharide biosynthesis transport protein
MNLAALSAVWARRKLLALVVFAVMLAAAVTVALALPGVYRSTATVLVTRQEMPGPTSRAAIAGELEARLNTISEELLSRVRLTDLMNRFDLYPALRGGGDDERAVERMKRDVKLELKGLDTQTAGRATTIAFAVSYLGREPATVARVTNELASSYVTENLKLRERQAADAVEDVKRQVADAQARLAEQEKRINEFKRRNIGQLPEQVAANLAMLERLNAQLALNNHNQIRAMERRAMFDRRPGDAGLPVAASPEEAMALRLGQLKQDLAKLRRTYSEKYPDVIALRTDIAETERALTEMGAAGRARPAGASTAAPAGVTREVDTEIAALKTEEQQLRRAIASYQGRVEIAPEREAEIGELSRDHRATKEVYDLALKRYADALAAEDRERHRAGEEFRILEQAVPGREPVIPNRLKLLLVGLMVSIAAAGVAVVLAEQVDTSFHGLDDLRSFTKLPVLANIPTITTRGDRQRRRWRLRLATSAVVVGILVVVGIAYLGAHGNDLLVSLLGRSGS